MAKRNYQVIALKDYQPLSYALGGIELTFDLDAKHTKVVSTVRYSRVAGAAAEPLVLDGSDLKLLSIALDGHALAEEQYELTAETLTIPAPPAAFTLTIATEISPATNKSLMGLYMSDGMFCTQCEAQGFRKITYFLDRPDAMTTYTTRIEADKKQFPILLGNGNRTASGDLADGRHFATFHDPFNKPCYLFALVAGDLAVNRDTYVTSSGKTVDLAIYTEHGQIGRTDFAMDSLKKSMKWDEDTYGLEYDLDIFSIVAVSSFNFGAMENKSLNIFNDQYVLADKDTATDSAFEGILAIVGHEYFHNWTGNRITCRDWFQLSLKEGLTVYRDHVFTEDLVSKDAVRISHVHVLRAGQFVEDAGPLAHPVRPESYIEIDNFYTYTVYEKGCEVIRMYHTLLGDEAFKKGIKLYFELYDGQAVTIEDFANAMAKASGVNLDKFKKWYSQAGTPRVAFHSRYDRAAKSFTVTASQYTKPTPGQPNKEPLVIPIVTGLLSRATGKPLSFSHNGKNGFEQVLVLEEAEQSFVLDDVAEDCVPSFLRGFSAPVIVESETSPEDLAFLMAHDTDGFNRFEATQTFAQAEILANIDRLQAGQSQQVSPLFTDSIAKMLSEDMQDARLKSTLLALPTTAIAMNAIGEDIDFRHLYNARAFLAKSIGTSCKASLMAIYQGNHDTGPFSAAIAAAGKRSLKNVALGYLMATGDDDAKALCRAQYDNATNMTDRLFALEKLCESGSAADREAALSDFAQRFKDDFLTMNSWFRAQAIHHREGVLAEVTALSKREDFDFLNPNRLTNLLIRFAQTHSPNGFHHDSGEGYRLVTDFAIKLNDKNPSIAANLAKTMTMWKAVAEPQRSLMKAQLERIKSHPGLSKNVFEIVEKSLA